MPTERQVADLEKKLGVPLPANYRRFVLEFNGGFFNEPEIVPRVEGCPVDGLTSLNGIGAKLQFAELGSDTCIFDDNEPVQVLPIGYTLMGNLLFTAIDPIDDLPGWIGLKIAWRDQSYWLADNIEDFFEMLREHKRSTQ